MRRESEKSLRIGVQHANAVVWGPVYRTHPPAPVVSASGRNAASAAAPAANSVYTHAAVAAAWRDSIRFDSIRFDSIRRGKTNARQVQYSGARLVDSIA